MLGKASETGMILFTSIEEYTHWKENWGANYTIIDVKFSLTTQSYDYQHGLGILVIYKEE